MTAVDDVFRALDKANALLATRRFLTASGRFTWLDLRLFHTLVRFDPVYHTYFKCNGKRIGEDYTHLLGFIRDVYQTFPAVASSVNLTHIKQHYFTSHPNLNRYAVVPTANGPDLTAPHGRGHLVAAAASGGGGGGGGP